MSADYPLVSAIMPTRNRPQFMRGALDCFLAQTWPNKELVIVDDATAPSLLGTYPVLTHPTTDHFGHCEIKFLVERRRLTIGAKRNRACAEASGDILCHWDDDDWSAPGRIEDQVKRLLESGVELTGYSEMEFRNGIKRHLYRGKNGYMLGTSLMYRREFWKRRPFADTSDAEDLTFQVGAKSVAVPAGPLMWASVHAGNTSPRNLKDAQFVELS